MRGSWRDRTRLALWPFGFVLGLAAEFVAFGFDEPGKAAADLITGWTVLACGLVLWRRDRRTGPLLAAVGITWFLGNFAGPALYLHRGPLIHALTLSPAVIVAGYAAAVVEPVWASEPLTLVLSAALALSVRRPAALALAGVLAAGALARLAYAGGEADEPALLAYELVLCGIALSFVAASRRSRLTDLVVELGERRAGLRDALAAALGDPKLELGYWSSEAAAFIGGDGRPIGDLPAGRERTLIERDGRPVAALVHEPLDATVVDAIASATRLAADNARLRAEVQAQITELAAARRRLIEAADDERRRLEQRLHEGAERRLQRLELALEDGVGHGRASELLDRTRADLRTLAAGLHPAQAGLTEALAALARDSPIPVALTVPPERLDPAVEAVAYFVCAEALANVTKYAEATRVEITIHDADPMLVEISDDGIGGADPDLGSGLRGIADRLQARGGTLRIASPRGGGTRLEAQIPR